MIKVLKLGNKVKREITCNNCESILEFTMEDCIVDGEDVFMKNGFDKIIKDLSYQQIILKCPCCDNEIIIKNINAEQFVCVFSKGDKFINEPILGKAESHGFDYQPMKWNAFLKLRESAQKVADKFGYPVYLGGSALYKKIPRDIDVSVIIPLDEYEEMFGKLPENQEIQAYYLCKVINKSFEYIKDLYFCIDYHLDIKVCPDTWWTEKPKMLLAEPDKYRIL